MRENNSLAIPIWVIYDHPMDYPDNIVVRKWIMDKPTDELIVCGNIAEARRKIPKGLYCIDRYQHDDPLIIEVWL